MEFHHKNTKNYSDKRRFKIKNWPEAKVVLATQELEKYVQNKRIAIMMNQTARDIPEIYFTEKFFRPFFDGTKYIPEYAKDTEKFISGIMVHFGDIRKVRAYDTILHIYDAICKLYPGKLEFYSEGYDNRLGTPKFKQKILSGGSVLDFMPLWHENADNFKKARQDFLLYD